MTARGGLSIAATRDVLAAIDEPLDPLATLGVVHYALPTPVDADETDAVDEQTPRVDALVQAMGWDVSPDSPHRRALAASLMDPSRLGVDYGTGDLVPYAELAAGAAKLDVDRLEELDDSEDRLKLAEHAAVVVLLLEPVLAVLRRLAQENETRRRAVWARATDEAGLGRPRATGPESA